MPVPGQHDLGTDIFVQVRDRRRYDLGLVVGVQVKAGSSYFGTPALRDDEKPPDGWWYAERDLRHFEYWTSHQLPHLLVLYNDAEETAYWVHVTAEAVRRTGRGAKILVPRARTLDSEHLDDLLAVAATARPALALEGTAWTGAEPPTASDSLRFAMVVPRLVAPHPNVGHDEPLTPRQAVALMMQARFGELRRNAERNPDAMPTLAEAETHPEWPWRFVGALAKRMFDDDGELLDAAIRSAPDPPSRAAAAVASASLSIEQGEPEKALATINETLADDEMLPQDHVWLTIQRARSALELGNVQDARAEVGELLATSTDAAGDVTATALRGVAAILLFNTAPWTERNIGVAIQATDTAARWWRTQTAYRGVIAAVERDFRAWSRDTSKTIGAQDEANNLLFVSALAASHLGDHAAWRHLATLLGRDSFLRQSRHTAAEEAANALAVVRLAGDEKGLKLAVARLVEDGPALAVRLAAAGMSPPAATRTSVFADLALIEHGGDLFDEDAAASGFSWLRALLDDARPLVRLAGNRAFDPAAVVLEALAGLGSTVPHQMAGLAANRVRGLRTDSPPLTVVATAKLLHAIPADAWTDEQISSMLPAPAQPEIRWVVLRIAAAHNGDARRELVAAARKGSLNALGGLGREQLDSELVRAVVPGLTRKLKVIRSEVRKGKLSEGRGDPAQALAVLVTQHPHEDGLEALLGFLEDDAVPRASKRRALTALAHNHSALNDDARQRLRRIAEEAPRQRPPVESPLRSPDIRGEAAYLAAVLAPDERAAAALLPRLLDGASQHRRWAAHLAALHQAVVPALLVLLGDDDPTVRAAAAAEAALRVARGEAEAALLAALQHASKDPGRRVALSIAETLATAKERPDDASALLAQLRAHPSAMVRSTAAPDR